MSESDYDRKPPDETADACPGNRAGRDDLKKFCNEGLADPLGSVRSTIGARVVVGVGQFDDFVPQYQQHITDPHISGCTLLSYSDRAGDRSEDDVQTVMTAAACPRRAVS